MVVLLSADEPDKIVAARIGNAGGIVVGLGKDENYLASDTPAILEHTRNVIYLESRQMVVVTAHEVKVETLDGDQVKPQIHSVSWDPVSAEKGEYRHFMQKEIHEQVRSITDTLAGRVDFSRAEIRLPDLTFNKGIGKKDRKDLHYGLRYSCICRDGGQGFDRKDCAPAGRGCDCLRIPI